MGPRGSPAAGDPSGTRVNAVLAERARALARPARAEERGDVVSLLLFAIGGVEHAVEGRFVREVLSEPALSSLPSSPAALVGVTNVRGEIVVVADISPLLGVAPPDVPGPVIVMEGSGPSLGVVVDDVHDFVEVPAASIAAIPDGGGSDANGASLLLGVTAQATVVSAALLLADPRLSITTEPRSGP